MIIIVEINIINNSIIIDEIQLLLILIEMNETIQMRNDNNK